MPRSASEAPRLVEPTIVGTPKRAIVLLMSTPSRWLEISMCKGRRAAQIGGRSSMRWCQKQPMKAPSGGAPTIVQRVVRYTKAM